VYMLSEVILMGAMIIVFNCIMLLVPLKQLY